MAVAVILAFTRNALPAGLMRPPEWLVWPFADWLNAAFAFCQNDLGLMAVTRFAASGRSGISSFIAVPCSGVMPDIGQSVESARTRA